MVYLRSTGVVYVIYFIWIDVNTCFSNVTMSFLQHKLSVRISPVQLSTAWQLTQTKLSRARFYGYSVNDGDDDTVTEYLILNTVLN